MKRLLCPFLCLLLLAGCSQRSPQEADQISPEKVSESQDITLTIGRRLPLPVTEDSLRNYYESPEGFDRQVLTMWGWEEDFCVCSVPGSDPDGGGSQSADTRFDYVYTKTGYCYTLLEGAYDPQDVTDAFPSGIILELADDPLFTLSASLDPALVDAATGELLSGSASSAVVAVSEEPRAYALEWWPLMPELWDGGPLTIPGGDGRGTPQSLNGVYTGADTLDLLLGTLDQGLFPEVQITYAPDVRELTLLCRNVSLNCQPSGGNLFIDSIRTEARGADTAVICTMTAPPVPGFSQYASALQIEQKHLDDLDRNEGILRLTFHSPLG